MWDVWIADLVLALVIPISTFLHLRQPQPRLLFENGVLVCRRDKPLELTTSQSVLRFLTIRFLPFILAIHFGFKLLQWPRNQFAHGPSWTQFWIVTSSLGAITVVALYYYKGQRTLELVKQEPKLATCAAPKSNVVNACLVLLLGAVFFVIGSCLYHEGHPVAALLSAVMAISAGLFFGTRMEKEIKNSKILVPEEDPIRDKIREKLSLVGLDLKSVHIQPGWLPGVIVGSDGTVTLASILRFIATDEEIAAFVLLSILKVQRDSKGFPIGMVLGFCFLSEFLTKGFIFDKHLSNEALRAPFFGFMLITFLNFYLMALSVHYRSVERRMDVRVGDLGVGPELASAVRKIAPFYNWPLRSNIWLRLFSATDPVETRVARILSPRQSQPDSSHLAR